MTTALEKFQELTEVGQLSAPIRRSLASLQRSLGVEQGRQGLREKMMVLLAQEARFRVITSGEMKMMMAAMERILK